MRVATTLAAMAILTMAGLCTAAVTPKPSMTLAPKWITTTSGALAAQGGFIGVSPAGGNPTALALNASTGAVKFTFQLPIDTNTTGLQWMTCPQSTNVAFLVALPGAVTATTSGVVFAVNALTGARLWSLPQEFAQFTELLIACSPDGASTIVLTDAGVTAVATANGAYKWTAMVNGSAVLSSSFTVSSKDGKSTFFIFQDNNGIHRVDIATGVSKLLFPTAFVPDGSLQSPLGVTKDLIIMNGAFNVTAFDTDGAAVWALEELGQAVYGDLLLTKRSVPSLSAYNATSGKPLWFWQNLSTEVTGASILNILNAAPDGSIIALGTPVAPSINAGISGQVGKVLWTEVSPATAGTPVASTHYIVYPPSILAPPNATQWAVNIVTGEVRVLTGLASVNSVAEADGLLLVEGQQHTAAYAAW